MSPVTCRGDDDRASYRVLASGAADDVLTTELVSMCFDHPITIGKAGGRRTARAS